MPDSSTNSVDLLNPMRSPLETSPAPSNSFLPADPLSNAFNLPTFSDRSSFTPDSFTQALSPLPIAGFNSGYFTVDKTGQVGIDYLFDGGSYEGELGIFSLSGLEQFDPGSDAFIQEVVRRILTDSTQGHLVIDDHTDAARFTDGTGWEGNFNAGDYLGVKTVAMNPGDTFGVALLPNGSFQQIVGNTDLWGNQRPLFSLATANPNQAFQFGQIADVTGNGSTFVLEDLSLDGTSDRDYNDIIFQFRGAIGVAANLDDVIAKDWRGSDFGQALLSYISPYDDSKTTQPIDYHFPPSNQPLIGVIDTGFAANNPDIDYSRITLGRDYIDGDINPLLNAGEGNEHGTHILGIIGATQNNGIGIDGINNQAPLWVGRAIGSGKWAESLVEFVNQALESNQPHAVVNLSLDLTQKNPDGSITTRYEFTPAERAALEYARQSGVLIVAAAGNDGGVMSVLGQASQEFDNILTVGAADGMNRADYSSYGYGLDILAPGNDVLSTVGNDVGTLSGTSVATAEVTGAISQVWAANPGLNYRQVIEILKATATDLDTVGWDEGTGFGALNLAEAIKRAAITNGEVYEPEVQFVPEFWDSEGTVQTQERAASPLNRQAAINYAHQYAKTRNPAYHDYSSEGGNCANFVSQCLVAGGLLPNKATSQGRNPYEYINANGLTNYLLNQGLAQEVNSISKLEPGDVIAYSWDGGPVMDHVAIYTGNGQVAGNTTDEDGWNWKLGVGDPNWYPNGTTKLLHIIQVVNSTGQNTTLNNTVGYDGTSAHQTYVNTFNRNSGNSTLGTPINNVHSWGNGYIQDFSGGSDGGGGIMKSNANDNSYWVGSDFWNKFLETGGAAGILGYPTSDRYSANGGQRQDFQSGAILKSNSGIFPVYGGIGGQYLNVEGGQNGRLGFPKSGEIGIGNGVIIQNFENGRIVYGDGPTRTEMYTVQPSNTVGYDGTSAHQTYVNTFNRNSGNSTLGTPINNVHSWGNGYIQDFSGGSDGGGGIMKSNANDNSYWVGSDFWNKFLETGGAAGILDYPISDRYSANGGQRQDFQGGAILKSNSGIFPVYGGIGGQYLNVEGGQNGRLGFPKSGEIGIGNGVIIQNFENGRIVYGDGPTRTEMSTVQPSTSVTINGNVINGSFYPVFNTYRGTLGNPVSGTTNYSSGVNYQLFEHGSIVSSNYGTFPLYGGIRQTYLNTGGLNGWLGVPTSAETSQGNGFIKQTFEHGYIIWNGSKAIAYRNGNGVSIPPTPISSPSPSGLRSTPDKLNELLSGGLNGQLIDVDGYYGAQCWDLVAYATGNRASTTTWRRGENIMTNGNVAVGTAIATFLGPNGSYDTPGFTQQHTAIFAGYGNENGVNGFYVWDQNWVINGSGAIKKHFIRASGSGTSNANNYYVIRA